MHNTPLTLIRRGLFLLLVLGLSACVSQRSGPQVDQEKAMESYVQLAMAYIETGNREAARHHLRRAFDLERNSVPANAAMAMLYQLEGEPELAEDRFRWVLRRDPGFSQARNNYGAFLFRQERYEEAFTQFERVSRDLDYEHRDRALLSLGRTALELDKPERAKAAFEHAHTLNRRSAPVLLELAEIYFNEQDYAQAKRFLDQYGELSRHTARSLLLGIRIERIFGNKDQEASYALALRNRFPYSNELLEYRRMTND
ncbi:type IV pilus biogenesis/stability protein PilW [Marinimicrobium sp. ABcell2]|uniref:type IV pilus biogenesis/stability protein PilW n=1 Tax=Marinimicrobium sp. ABcell2 TaxID=3069751 RepID=UPI0027B77CCB|nr:type IV pilus biogenesis/stability protein PilW [Marinimicrobium sp. ABcell2]MDQ2077265.1 type IV pilus biogenesis/stability protein PilW [Marinimicrobium sp. ABcell2]